MNELKGSGSRQFLPRGGAEFADRGAALALSAPRGLILYPWTEPMRTLAVRLAREVPAARLCVHESEASAAGALPRAAWNEVDAVILDSAPGKLGDDLLQLVDLPWLRVLAPRTEEYFLNRPLFLISIPKAGTNLLLRLAAGLGFEPGIVGGEFPRPGMWYVIDGFSTHAVARSFLVERSSHAPFGNSHHPFVSAPALFIYRNPLDVLVSEANYYHLPGNSPFAAALAGLSFEQRLERLLEDPWLLGTIRHRVGGYMPWLDFPNVVPVSFEELVGAEGGGTEQAQAAAVWSVQLKLQAPGAPRAIAADLYSRSVRTFREGRIGASRQAIPATLMERFRALPQDFMESFGYGVDDAAGTMPRRTAEFRHRPLRVAPRVLDEVPIALEHNHLGFNLVRFAGWIYAVPQATGPGFDLRRQAQSHLCLLPRERDLPALKHRLFVKSLWWGGNPELLSNYVVARLSRADAWGGALRALLRTAARGLFRSVARTSRAAREAKE